MRALIQRTPQWAWIWMVFFLLAGCVPVLLAILVTPSGKVFTGVMNFTEDTNSYLANMQQACQGNWLYILPYTAKRSTPVPLFTVYFLLGHIARFTGLSASLVFHLARIGCAGIFVLSAYHFIACFLSDETERKLTFALLLFTGGLGFFSALATHNATMEMLPDIQIPEATSFGSLLVNPHFTLSMAFMIWLVLASMRFSQAGDRGSGVLAVVAGIGLAVVHPHQLAVVGLVIGVNWMLRFRQAQRVFWIEGIRIGMVFVPVAIVAGALTLVTLRNDALAAWLEQNNMFTPPVWSMAFLLYGPLLGLALAATAIIFWTRQDELYPVALWFIVVLVLIYVPVNFQRRFTEGWHLPIVMLSAMVWRRKLVPWIAGHIAPRAAHMIGVTGFACLALSPLLLLSYGVFQALNTDSPHIFLSSDTYQAVRWIRAEAEAKDSDIVVLASHARGNMIPAWAPVRTVLGHWSLTAFVDERTADVEHFFDSSTPHYERIAILENLGVNYVYFGDEERDIGDFDPASASYLEPVFMSGTTFIYQFHNK